MARFLVLWRRSLTTPSMTDPADRLKHTKKTIRQFDDLIKKGLVKELGFFPTGGTGSCMIVEGEATDVFRIATMFRPYYECEVHEMIPWEQTKEIITALQAEAAKK